MTDKNLKDLRKEILRFDHVSIAYGTRDVVKDVSFSIREGEFVSLIGPNGSGKSTMIQAACGIMRLKAGQILLDGQDTAALTARQRAQITAVVPQTFQANFAFRAKEIVAMGRHPFLGRMQSESEEDYRIVDDALEKTGTLHLRERRITQLSGGERQRIIISAALAQQPKLLILDEPTNHLDIQYTLEVMQLMRRLNQEQGMTIFAVLHDINMAARFSDRIIVLGEGSKVMDGPVSQVIKEDVLKPVYKIDLVVRDNPLTDSAEIVALRSNRRAEQPDNGRRIHVICGGGSGSYYIEALRNKGWQLSCGVLSPGDSDYEVCKSLGIAMAEEKPYSDIGQDAYERNMQLASSADVVLLTDVDIGHSNLKNIEIMRELAGSCDIWILRENARDYTGGRADAVISDLLQKGQAAVITREELEEQL